MIYPVILSGGVGSRLWPTSRSLFPKQLLPLLTERTMLQETVSRVTGGFEYAPPLIVSNNEHRFIIAQQLQDMGVGAAAHLLEPVGKNTAPAIAAAATFIQAKDPKGILLVLPADHHIEKLSVFHAVVAKGAALARAGKLVAFGIVPTQPETGYGYIRRGDVAGEGFTVAEFVEKPDLETARAYLADGGYSWNSGMFMFGADRILEEMKLYCPQIVAGAAEATLKGTRDLDFLRLQPEAFESCPADSIDYAVMEHTKDAAVVLADIGWSDVGSWSALWDIGKKDKDGNVVSGDVLTQDASNNYVRAESGLVALVGIDDVVVIATDDAVLVAHRDRVQDVKKIVEQLRSASRGEADLHRRVYRPWGYYEGVTSGERHQVKHLMVYPGASLSLQMHYKRAEHWVVVRGQARVTVGDNVMILNENESTYIPVETRHRLENPGTEPLSLIEVQSGVYLGEDDIVRFDDIYGRVPDQASAAE